MSATKKCRSLHANDVGTPTTNSARLLLSCPYEIIAVMLRCMDAPEGFKAVQALRLTCKYFRSIFQIVPLHWWENLIPLTFDLATQFELFNSASILNVWPTKSCHRKLEFDFKGSIESKFLPSKTSLERLAKCVELTKQVNPPLKINISVFMALGEREPGSPLKTLGNCFDEIANTVEEINISGLPGNHKKGLIVDVVFPKVKTYTLSGVSQDNLEKAFPEATKCKIIVSELNRDDNETTWPLPVYSSPQNEMDVTISNSHTVILPKEAGADACFQKLTFDRISALSIPEKHQKLKTSTLVFKDTGILTLLKVPESPLIETPKIVITGDRLPREWMDEAGVLFNWKFITSVSLTNVRMFRANDLTELPDTVENLSVVLCTADYANMSTLNKNLKKISFVADYTQVDSVFINDINSGDVGPQLQTMYLEIRACPDAITWTINLTNATNLSDLYIEGFSCGINLIIPENVPLESFGIGINTRASFMPLVVTKPKKVLKRLLINTNKKVSNIMNFVFQRADVKALDSLVSKNALMAMIPSIVTSKTGVALSWLRDSVARNAQGLIKPMLNVLIACLERRQVSQQCVSCIHVDMARFLAFLFPWSFYETYHCDVIAVHPEDAWICERSKKRNGAPPVNTRQAVRCHQVNGPETNFEICPSDKFVRMYKTSQGWIVFQRIAKITDDHPLHMPVEKSVRTLLAQDQIIRPTMESFLRIIRNTRPDLLSSHAHTDISKFVSSLSAPYIVTKEKNMPGVEAMEKCAYAGIGYAKSNDDIKMLVSRHAGYGPGFRDLIIVTGSKPTEEAMLKEMNLVPSRVSALRSKTIAITDRDFKSANLSEQVTLNMCGSVRWVVLQHIKQDASTDAIMSSFCTLLHLCSNTGPA